MQGIALEIAQSICQLAEERVVQDQAQAQIVRNIHNFNELNECPCCEKHSRRRPFDVLDKGYNSPTYIGITHQNVHVLKDRDDMLRHRFPRVFTFVRSCDCECPCRCIMRTIAERLDSDVSEKMKYWRIYKLHLQYQPIEPLRDIHHDDPYPSNVHLSVQAFTWV